MTLKHINFYDSAVMRELERQEIKNKGIEKEAFVKEKVVYASSNNLLYDLSNLSEGLRSVGLTKEADSLDEKVLMYKIAETHLYRVFDEDGEDLIGFAHPGSNPNISPTNSEYGIVEDILNTNKKIVDITRKVPTGKQGKINNTLTKIADLFDFDSKKNDYNASYKAISFWIDEAINFLSELDKNEYKGIYVLGVGDVPGILQFGDKVLVSLVAMDKKPAIGKSDEAKTALNFYLKVNNIDKDVWNDFMSRNSRELFNSMFKPLFSKEKIENANNEIKKYYNKYLGKLKEVSNVLNNLSNNKLNEKDKSSLNIHIKHLSKALDVVGQLFGKNSAFMLWALTGGNTEKEHEYRYSYVPKFVDPAKKILDKLKLKTDELEKEKQPGAAATGRSSEPNWGWWKSNVASKIDRLVNNVDFKMAHKDTAAELEKISTILKTSNSWEEAYQKLKSINSKNAAYDSINKLDKVIMKWEDYVRNKSASLNKNIVKNALDLPPSEPTKQVSEPSQKKTQVARTPQRKYELTDEEYKAVANMQFALRRLAEFVRNKEGFEKWNESLIDLYGIGGSGRKGTFSVDGMWGPRTKNALILAEKILKEIDPEADLDTESIAVSGGQRTSDKNLAQAALNNLNVLNNVLVKHFDAQPVGKFEDPNAVYDELPFMTDIVNNFNTYRVRPNRMEGEIAVPLKESDVSSFGALYDFLSENNFVSGIHHDIVTNKMVEGFPLDVWDVVLKYLRLRAGTRVYDNLPKSEDYLRDVNKLHNYFKPMHEKYEGSDYVVVGPGELDSGYILKPTKDEDVEKSQLPGAGAKGRTENNIVPVSMQGPIQNPEGVEYQFSAVQSPNIAQQPISYYLNLRELHDNYPNSMRNWDEYAKLLARKSQLDVQAFQGDPQNLAANLLPDISWPEVLDAWGLKGHETFKTDETGKKWTYNDIGKFPTHPVVIKLKADAKLRILYKVISALKTDLMYVIDEWEDKMYQQKMHPQAVRANNTAWQAWSRAMNELIRPGGKIERAIKRIDRGDTGYFSS